VTMSDPSIRIVFESHATSVDNELELASGWFDTPLSELGLAQAEAMAERYVAGGVDRVFCSDLQRSFKTAEIAFGGKCEVIADARLRECDYGSLTRAAAAKIEKLKPECIHDPFPGGESYRTATERVMDFLLELWPEHVDRTIAIVGHRATQYGIERLINRADLGAVVLSPWQWQPGWKYEWSRKTGEGPRA
jgi:broad specificity phosphatase PhoE